MKIRERIVVAYVGLLVIMLMLLGVSLSLTSDVSGNPARLTIINNRAISNAAKIFTLLPKINVIGRTYFGPDPKNAAVRDEFSKLSAEVDQLTAALKAVTIPGTEISRKELEAEWTSYQKEIGILIAMPLGDSKDVYYYNVLRVRNENIRQRLSELIGASLDQIDEEIANAQSRVYRNQMILLGLAALGVVLCIGFLMAIGQVLVRPAKELVEVLDTMAESRNFNIQVPRMRPDEIGNVAAALERLLDKLKEARSDDRKLVRRAERRSEHAMDCIPDAVLLTNREGQKLYANKAAQDLLKQQSSSGTNCIPWPVVQKMFANAVRTAEPQVLKSLDKAVQLFVGGEEHFYLPAAFPLTNDQGAVDEVVVLMNDVSYLHQLDEMKVDLVATVSHQLKTPLTSIRLGLHMLRSSVNPSRTEMEEELLEMAFQESERLQATIQNLLDMARIQAGAVQMQLEAVQGDIWLQSLAEQYRSKLAEGQITLELEIESELPTLNIDEPRMGVVIDNLLTNCAKYCRPGDKVVISARGDDNDPHKATITVTDNGPGIAASDINRIFERFYRGENNPQAGAGLGLSIARKVVLAHGGEMTCHSELGKGTSFTITLYNNEAHIDSEPALLSGRSS